jgi:hypothetical protein
MEDAERKRLKRETPRGRMFEDYLLESSPLSLFLWKS